MLNPNSLLDKIRTALRANADFVTAMGGTATVIDYRSEAAPAKPIQQQVYEMSLPAKPSALIVWRGTRTGNFGSNDAIKHEISVHLAAADPAVAFTALRDGQVSGGPRFKLYHLDPAVRMPENMSIIRNSFLIGEDIFDSWEVQMTFTERADY